MHRLRTLILPGRALWLSLLLLIVGARGAEVPPFANYNLGSDRLALKGYDPVNYFSAGKALRGRKDFTAQHQGVTYQFASAEHREMFLAAPEKHLPTYGGWCATAMAKGKKVDINPENFKVTGGRLFLFYTDFFTDARKDWIKDESGNALKADANWRRIAGE